MHLAFKEAIMQENESPISLIRDITEVKKLLLLITAGNLVTDKWIPRCHIMDFFEYGNTQMACLEKEEGLVMSKIGKRKFYHRDSIEKLLEKYIILPKK